MRLAVTLLTLAGCNELFGLDRTQPGIDAPTVAALCDPLPFDANRYMQVNEPSAGIAWQQARSECQMYGLDLAVLDASDGPEIANEQNGGMLPFWLGVSYDGTGWTAIDGCPPELVFAAGEPTSPVIGDCLVQAAGGLKNVTCSALFDGTNGISALCETPRPSPQCRAYATQRDYLLLTSTITTPVTHDDGAQMCAALGRHIVEIDSTDELDYLLAHDAANVPAFWIGATRTNTTWTSPTGCPQVFTWIGVPGTALCSVYAGGMRDATCYDANNATYAVICELNVAM